MKKFLLLLALVSSAANAQVMVSQDARKPSDSGSKFSTTTTPILAKNETRAFWVKLTGTGCITINVAPELQAASYSALTIPVTTPSYLGGATGNYVDPLKPLSGCPESDLVLLDVGALGKTGTFDVTITQGAYSAKVSATVVDATLPPPFPIFVGSSNITPLKYHCNSSWCGDPGEAGIAKLYLPLIKAHGLTPMQSYVFKPAVVNGKLDLDFGGDISFRKTVLDYMPGMVWFPSGIDHDDNYYKALEATIKAENLVGRAWVYPFDEPNLNDTGMLSLVLTELTRIHTLVPSVKVMMTKEYDPRLQGKVDIFVPVMEYFDRKLSWVTYPDATAYPKGGLWMYGSCMAHGQCKPNRQVDPDTRSPGIPTGTPDMSSLDQVSTHVRAFVWMSARYSEISALLYYSLVEQLNLYGKGIGPWKDLYNFGGNGDGTLVYPVRPGEHGSLIHQVWPSVRMKLLREALNDRGWLSLKPRDVKLLIPDTTHFSKDYSAYQAVRDEIASSYLVGASTSTATATQTNTLTATGTTIVSTATSSGTGTTTTVQTNTGTGVSTNTRRVGYLKPNTAKTQWTPVLVAPTYKVPTTWQKAPQFDEVK